MAQELKYKDLQEIAAVSPEITGQLLELQELAEELGGDPEEWIAFALTVSAIGRAYEPKQEQSWLNRPWIVS